MSRDCPAAPPALSIQQLVHDHILNSGRRCFVVVQDSRPVGLITMHDIKKVPRDRWHSRTVGEAMTPLDRTKWVRPTDDLYEVFNTLTTEDINQLPVMEDGNLVGMIRRDSILSFIRVRGELGV
jgi:CBS domain-containing protein